MVEVLALLAPGEEVAEVAAVVVPGGAVEALGGEVVGECGGGDLVEGGAGEFGLEAPQGGVEDLEALGAQVEVFFFVEELADGFAQGWRGCVAVGGEVVPGGVGKGDVFGEEVECVDCVALFEGCEGALFAGELDFKKVEPVSCVVECVVCGAVGAVGVVSFGAPGAVGGLAYVSVSVFHWA